MKYWEGNGDVLPRSPSRKGCSPAAGVLSANHLWQSAPAETASLMETRLTLEPACLQVAQAQRRMEEVQRPG